MTIAVRNLILASLVSLGMSISQARQLPVLFYSGKQQEELDTNCSGANRQLLADCYRNTPMDSCLKLWRDDSYGCKGQRTLGLMLRLREDLKLDSIPLDSVLQLMGQPNELYYDNSASQDGRNIKAVYYMQGECIGGAPDYRATIHLRMTLYFRPD